MSTKRMSTNKESRVLEPGTHSVWQGGTQRLSVIASCALLTLAMGSLPESAEAQTGRGSHNGSVVGAGAAGARVSSSRSSATVSRSRGETRKIRGRRNAHSSYRSSYRHSSFYLGLASPWAWYGGYYPYGYSSYGYGYGPYRSGYDYYYRGNAGALDLDIKPEEAQIYVDGDLVGIADNYDGFPRYLWLEAGTHNIVIYHEGLETLGKQIKMNPGVVVRLKDRMVAGSAKSPDEMYAQLGPLPGAEQSTEESGETRLAPWRFADRAERRDDSGGADTSNRGSENQVSRSSSSRSSESWRERGGGSRAAGPVQRDFRAEAGEVSFSVEPADAVIYLDGRLVGSGAELAEQEQPLLVDPGNHVVEVTRPGYGSKKLEFSVNSGASETVQITLEKNN